jgi:lipooligosaccharide transport system permease protein
MNGAIYESGNVFWKLRYRRTYDAVLATPVRPADVAVGETTWSLFRGLIYSAGFVILMASLGLIHSVWAVLALPAAFLICFAFAGAAVAATTYMRTWQDFEIVQLVQLPMFLFSTTFYPLSTYPTAVQWFVRATPLYHAIGLLRGLTIGVVGWWQLGDVLYLAALGAFGIALATRRIHRALLS